MMPGNRILIAATLPLLALAACRGSLQVSPNDAATVLAHQALTAPDPGLPGPYTVGTFYYGSGTDRNRAEYRDSVTLVTEPVDGSKLVDLGSSARARNSYWGFTPAEMPLNGRVWYPEGDGPFPLVLVVHGNHDMRDFSDPGYDYLGELLASRGFVLVSVDMNFINGGFAARTTRAGGCCSSTSRPGSGSKTRKTIRCVAGWTWVASPSWAIPAAERPRPSRPASIGSRGIPTMRRSSSTSASTFVPWSPSPPSMASTCPPAAPTRSKT
jgi:hypothetical protein